MEWFSKDKRTEKWIQGIGKRIQQGSACNQSMHHKWN